MLLRKLKPISHYEVFSVDLARLLNQESHIDFGCFNLFNQIQSHRMTDNHESYRYLQVAIPTMIVRYHNQFDKN